MNTQKLIVEEKSPTPQFQIGDIMGIAFTLGVTAIGIAYMLNVMSDVKSDMTENSTEWTATGEGITAIAKFPEKLGLIVTVVIAAIIIGILIRYLWINFKG